MGKPSINKATILKIVCLVLLFIVTVVGCHAHFNNAWKDAWNEKLFREGCKLVSDCPSGAMDMERTFVAFTIIFLILSTISIVAGFVMDASKIKLIDAGYHALAGLLILISGILLIVAAVKIDDVFTSILSPFVKSSPSFREILMPKASFLPDIRNELRKELKYSNKLAAGALAIINGLLYFVTSAIIFKS